MLIDSNSTISITEVNECGKSIISKNNQPDDVLLRFQDEELQFLSKQEILDIGGDFLEKFKDEFLKMAE